MNNFEIMLQALVTVREAVPALQEKKVERPFDATLGICANVYWQPEIYDNADNVYLMLTLRDRMQEWPSVRRGKNAQLAYPVGGYDEYVEERITGAVWTNKRRLELLDWLIKDYTEQVELRLAYKEQATEKGVTSDEGSSS